MKLNANALTNQEALKASTHQENEPRNSASTKIPEKVSPQILERKKPPPSSVSKRKEMEGNPCRILFDQERIRHSNIPYRKEEHLDLVPIELPGFKVHMKLEEYHEIPRIPKAIKEDLKNKPNFVSVDSDLNLPPMLYDKETWHGTHLDLIRPVHCH